MGGIFGILRRDGGIIAPSALETMRQSIADWGHDGSDVRLDGAVGLGQLRLFCTPEAGMSGCRSFVTTALFLQHQDGWTTGKS